MEYFIIYSIGYVFVSVLIVLPPTEFVTAGLTLPALLSPLIGAEDDLPQHFRGRAGFVWFHIRRSAATLLVHSLLPLGFFFLNFQF